ncbi:Pr6Pr family membrane protein [Kineococcus terrestris]|uniref:Pr6Pr family membrane protein n=2 Tax=Kineococcus terrestris TaxID=2044856 RepID=UPI0034DACD87
MRHLLTALRALVVVLVVLGVLWVPAAGWDDPRLTPAGIGTKLVYFTIQSNLLLAAVLAVDVVARLRSRAGPSPWLVGGATFFVTITGVVYNTLLVPGGGPEAVLLLAGRPSSDLLHAVVPALALLDWVLFRPHGVLSVRRSLVWLVYPFAYSVFAIVRGGLVDSSVRYPYWFLDPTEIGWGGVGLAFAALLPAFAVLACLFVGCDRVLGRARRRASLAATEGE